MKKLLVLAAFAAFSFSNISAQTISAAPVSEEVSVMSVTAENPKADKDKGKEKKKSKKKAKECSDSKEKSCGAGEKKKGGCCSHEAAPKKEGNQ